MDLQQTNFRKTRIAPTPSGYLHLGNVLSFVLTAGLAAQHGAQIVLRIDDLDQARTHPLYLQDIFDTLRFLELPWHEGPRDVQQLQQTWSQRHRLPLYKQALQQLTEAGLLFACTCSRSELHNPEHSYNGACLHKALPADTPGACLRLRTDAAGIIHMNTLAGPQQETLPASLQYAVLRRKDGVPAYQLASVTDDLHFGTDLVVRGADLLPSTILQLYLAQLLGAGTFLQATFFHHPLLLERTGLKLSKSAGATSVQYLRKAGCKAADIYRMIAADLGARTGVATWKELYGELEGLYF